MFPVSIRGWLINGHLMDVAFPTILFSANFFPSLLPQNRRPSFVRVAFLIVYQRRYSSLSLPLFLDESRKYRLAVWQWKFRLLEIVEKKIKKKKKKEDIYVRCTLERIMTDTKFYCTQDCLDCHYFLNRSKQSNSARIIKQIFVPLDIHDDKKPCRGKSFLR